MTFYSLATYSDPVFNNEPWLWTLTVLQTTFSTDSEPCQWHGMVGHLQAFKLNWMRFSNSGYKLDDETPISFHNLLLTSFFYYSKILNCILYKPLNVDNSHWGQHRKTYIYIFTQRDLFLDALDNSVSGKLKCGCSATECSRPFKELKIEEKLKQRLSWTLVLGDWGIEGTA